MLDRDRGLARFVSMCEDYLALVAARIIVVSEVMLRGIGLHQAVNITLPIDDILQALRTWILACSRMDVCFS